MIGKANPSPKISENAVRANCIICEKEFSKRIKIQITCGDFYCKRELSRKYANNRRKKKV